MYDREQPAEPRAIPPHNGSMALPDSVLGQPVDVDYHWDGLSAAVEDITVQGVSVASMMDGMYKYRHGSKSSMSVFQLIAEAIEERIGEEYAYHDE